MSGLRQYRFIQQNLVPLLTDGEMLFVSGEWQGNPGKPTPYQDWPWQRARCSFRTVLQREVLFDFDLPTWPEVVAEVQKLAQRLEAVGAPYYLYNSGGKGAHLSVYLDAEDLHHVASWKQLRLKFWEWATHLGAITDRIKVVWGTFTVVRTEGAIRRLRPSSIDDLFRFRSAMKVYHDVIPVSKPVPTRDVYPEQLVPFQLPTSFLLTLDNENGIGECQYCQIPLSQRGVVYDEFAERFESLTCAICRSKQHLLVKQYPLEGEWVNAMPLDWLP